MRRRGNRAVAAAALTTLTLCAFDRAQAATGTWSGAGSDTTWSTPANWLGNIVPGTTGGLGGGNSDTALFTGTLAGGGTASIAVDAGRNIANITFDALPVEQHVVIGATDGNPLFLSNGGIAEVTATNSDALQTVDQTLRIAAPLVLGGTDYTVRANAPFTAGSATAPGSISFQLTGAISAGAAAATTLVLEGTNRDPGNAGQSKNQVHGVITDGAAAGNGGLGITKNGTGTWELRPGGVTDGSAAGTVFPTNSYTGPTSVNAGILRVSGPGGISPFSEVIVNPTGAIRFSVNASSANNPGLHPVLKRITVNTNNNASGGTAAAGSLNASNASTQTILQPPSGPALVMNFQNLVATANLDGNAVLWFRGATDRDGGVEYNASSTTLTTILGRGAAPYDLGTVNRPFDVDRGNAANALDLDVASPITGAGGVIKIGDGAMRIRGAIPLTGTTFTGPVEVQAGTLVMGGTLNSGVNSVLVNGGTFDIQGVNQNFGAVTLTKGALKSSTGVFGGTSYAANVVGADVGTFNAILGNGTGGPSSLTKTGNGLARLHASATYTGSTTVSDGTFRVASDAAIGPSSALILNGPGVLLYSDTRADAVLAPSLSISDTAVLDLGDNDMVVQSATPKSTVETYIRNGRNGGSWNGTGGISSGPARANVSRTTGLGAISGAEYNTVGGTGTFGGQTYAAGDTLVKYTWNGDANFSGTVTFDDYVKIDTGFNLGRTGWLNGDFNYSGSVNFDDYVLIDVAFNAQSGTLGRAVAWISGDDRSTAGLDSPGLSEVIEHYGQFGSSYGAAFLAAVPEPTALLAIAAPAAVAGMLRRRRRHD